MRFPSRRVLALTDLALVVLLLYVLYQAVPRVAWLLEKIG